MSKGRMVADALIEASLPYTDQSWASELSSNVAALVVCGVMPTEEQLLHTIERRVQHFSMPCSSTRDCAGAMLKALKKF